MTKIDSLTGLRLVAALAVFGSHVAVPAAMPGAATTALAAGYNGVTLFFVLSGFVLTWTYAERLARPARADLVDFAIARFARIAPLYFAALAFSIVLVGGRIPDGTWMHVLALQAWSGDLDLAMSYYLNGPGWSVGVEVFLYACFPVVLWAMLRLPARRVAGAVACLVLALAVLTLAVWLAGAQDLAPGDPWSAHRLLYRTPLTRLADFGVGVGVALLVMRSTRIHQRAAAAQWASLAAIAMLMSSDLVLDSVVSYDVAYLPLFALLIWSLASDETAPVARFLAHPLVVRGGLISYAFYLFHVPALKLIPVDSSTWSAWTLSTAAALVLALLFAAAAHRWLEVPAHRWIRDMTKRPLPQRVGEGAQSGCGALGAMTSSSPASRS